jgi:hypothetical protein
MPKGIDDTAEEWVESAGHFPLTICEKEEMLLLHWHWMWANVQREAMEGTFGTEDMSVDDWPAGMASRGIAFMFVWYGMLWSVIEACTRERKIDLRGALKADIDEVSPKLKQCRHAIMHVPKSNELLDERIADLVGGVSATTIRRIHRGFGRLFHAEMQRRTAENLTAQALARPAPEA